MPVFKQHLSVAARGIEAFLHLEASVLRAVRETERASARAKPSTKPPPIGERGQKGRAAFGEADHGWPQAREHCMGLRI
jgi:hypothetical protein